VCVCVCVFWPSIKAKAEEDWKGAGEK